MSLVKWVRAFPKVELHAHLSASITRSQLKQLLAERGLGAALADFEKVMDGFDANPAGHSLDYLFQKLFSFVPLVMQSTTDLERIVQLIFQNFIEDGVVYLELRSYPKNLGSAGFREYLEAVIRQIKKFEGQIEVRFVCSVNRDQPPAYYDNLIPLIKSIPEWQKYIVGLDFSGNPNVRKFSDFRHIFEEGRQAGLRCALHSPEVPKSDADLQDMLNFKPDRLGHFLFYSEAAFDFVIKHKIPVEVCPTSNQIVKGGPVHNFLELYQRGLRDLTICTDDWLLFDKSVSEEIDLFAQETGVTRNELAELLRKTPDFIFDEAYKPILRDKIAKFLASASD